MSVTLDGKTVITDNKGLYLFDGLSAGDYTLTFEKENYFTNTQTVTVINGIIVTKNIEMITQITGFVYVQGGTFEMGSNDGDNDEQPFHTVTLNDFYIKRYEVTQSEWGMIMGNNPSHFNGDNLPVEQITWFDAVQFCNKLSELERLTKFYAINGTDVTMNWDADGYRLPTEAEWEYAARGGNQSHGYTYSGSNKLDDVAWYWDNSGSSTHEVGTKQPNELGIYDMSGNVWEWCNDWYSSSYYSQSPNDNPHGPSSGSIRIRRGGYWANVPSNCRVADRAGDAPNSSHNYLGFRIARSAR